MINNDKKLSRNQIKAIELLAFKGLTQKEVATKLEIHENTITNWKKDDLFMKELDKANRQSIDAASSKAIGVMLGLLNAKSEMVRFNAAKDILDRAGYKPSDKLELENKTQESMGKLDAILFQLRE